MTTEKGEIKRRNMGVIASVAAHLFVLLCFFFLMAWRAPSPPIPKYGIELRFGLDATGGINEINQTRQEVSDETSLQEAGEQLPVEEDLPEKIPPQEEVSENKSAPPTTDFRSKDSEIKEEAVKEVTKTTKKEKAKSVKVKPVKPVAEKDKKSKTPNPKKPQVTYQPPKIEKNYGDDPGVEGNKGKEEGVLDAKALYGNQGGGVGLDLAGWDWDRIPSPYIPHNESGGRIEFEIRVDRNGDIIAYRVLERSLSIDAERACREAISQLTFTKKVGAKVPPVSVGKITFLVRAR